MQYQQKKKLQWESKSSPDLEIVQAMPRSNKKVQSDSGHAGARERWN